MTIAPQPVPVSRGPLTIITLLTGVVGVGIIAQGVIAGMFVGGNDSQRAIDVHEILGPLLALVGLASAVISNLRLRGSAQGQRVAYATLGLTAALAVEVALGFISSEHSALLALHVPVAIGVFGLLIRISSALRALRSPVQGASAHES